jgi:hypothetical protein
MWGAGGDARARDARLVIPLEEVEPDMVVDPDSVANPGAVVDPAQRRAIAVLAEAGLVSPRPRLVPRPGEDAAA